MRDRLWHSRTADNVVVDIWHESHANVGIHPELLAIDRCGDVPMAQI
ncbi:hypothetical protein [Chamaesiphon sp. VAR_69_metabat_338]|nr:hypothetical protein [Chamaesiphon sp. VAR_69_metabat_338]